ncbi:Hypothetical protein PHPALM_13850 [Phytophthora palmivora]|uniref:Uncharacterized protein n=1 Tax=Phytophthora palmivora TaxID=4796 RepID=A0A2P4XWJ2_9STRA|nr:Hypothetical protein PHPALM_13850 [Phytophthora palmivora]
MSTGIENNAKHQLTPTIFAIGGFNHPGALNTVEYLDFHRSKWYPAALMTTCLASLLRAPTKFYMGGTSSSSHHHKTKERYDPEINMWTSMPPMKNI